MHDSRDTHATLLLAAGEPLHVVADRLGHKDAMVTSTVYAHVLAEKDPKTIAVASDFGRDLLDYVVADHDRVLGALRSRARPVS